MLTAAACVWVVCMIGSVCGSAGAVAYKYTRVVHGHAYAPVQTMNEAIEQGREKKHS